MNEKLETMVPVTSPMTPEMDEKLRIHAAVRHISRSEMIRLIVKEFLDKNPNPTSTIPVSINTSR